MDPEESSLRPCKPLPSSTSDRYASQNMMGQHPSSPSVYQGENTTGTSGASQKLALQIGEDSGDSEDEMELPACKKSRLLKGKEKEASVETKKEGPVQLLDLPLDILKDVLKEVTHTNDLANLALVNSTLHGVVTPMIYSRFDIVWPDSLSSAEPRAGVDALTYGLATLVMREDLFDNVVLSGSDASRGPFQSYSCTHCGSTNYLSQESKPLSKIQKTRRGNYFSQFTKKFSLGNGPADWVQEYLVTKESGKMLGTLVALSVARMPNLETFIWDMPTGILRDIWISLASLGDYQPSKLEKLWVRLHDNKAALQEAGIMPTTTASQAPSAPSGPSPTLPASQSGLRSDAEIFGVSRVVWSNHHVESPNFSIVPPLRSLTVLDIDEVKYLVELSVLLGRSINTLRELRLGMASTLHTSGYARDAPDIQPLLGGGVFSLLMSKIYNHMSAIGVLQLMRPKYDTHTGKPLKRECSGILADPGTAPLSNTLSTMDLHSSEVETLSEAMTAIPNPREQELPANEVKSSPLLASSDVIDPALLEDEDEDDAVDRGILGVPLKPQISPVKSSAANDGPLQDAPTDPEPIRQPDNFFGTPHSAGTEHGLFDTAWKLKLETLEIEKVTLSSPVLGRAIDFRVLTSLTLLECGDSAALWSILMREYPPRRSLIVSTTPPNLKSSTQPPRLRRKPSSDSLSGSPEYQLALKRIHTDAVSKELVTFIKSTLAPNSLEWMFLQDNPSNLSSVSLDTVYRGPLRRHRSSLTKVMIDSIYGPATSRSRSAAAKKWMFSREVLTFVTSGKMSKLRELAMAVEYKDWHFFLQKLPNIPHLRSLYVPHIADHPYGSSLNYKEFAMGAVDTVALRPEIQLCYLGIRNKCFEILETKNKSKTSGSQSSIDTEGDTDDDGQDTDHHDDDDDSDDGAPSPPPAAHVDNDSDAGERSALSDDEDDSVDPGKRKLRFKLREILFYDDKISIFKARHGRL